MHLMHGGNTEPEIVQAQHRVHLCLNATERCGDRPRNVTGANRARRTTGARERETNMAYATDIRTGSLGLFRDRFDAILESFRKARAQRKVYRETLAELNSLNDRELDDIGIHATEIPFIAREAAAMAT